MVFGKSYNIYCDISSFIFLRLLSPNFLFFFLNQQIFKWKRFTIFKHSNETIEMSMNIKYFYNLFD